MTKEQYQQAQDIRSKIQELTNIKEDIQNAEDYINQTIMDCADKKVGTEEKDYIGLTIIPRYSASTQGFTIQKSILKKALIEAQIKIDTEIAQLNLLFNRI